MDACLDDPGQPCGSDYCPMEYSCQRGACWRPGNEPDVCGNGATEPAIGEVCDDGNKESGDGCSADCLSDERCNDGNDMSGDGCSADGKLEPGFMCTDTTCCADPESSFALVGAANFDRQSNEVILVESQDGLVGAAWLLSSVDLAEPFEARLRVYLGAGELGGDGMAVVFHRDDCGPECVGKTGAWLGANGIGPALIIQFDTYYNVDLMHEIECDYAMIIARASDAREGSVAYEQIVVPPTCLARENVEDGKYHDLEISWRPGAQLMEIFFDGNQLIAFNGSIVADYFNGDSKNIYFGITASTGAASNEHKICLPERLVAQGTEQ